MLNCHYADELVHFMGLNLLLIASMRLVICMVEWPEAEYYTTKLFLILNVMQTQVSVNYTCRYYYVESDF